MDYWKKEDIEYLSQIYPTQVKISEIISKLGRSRRAILHKAARLGLSRPHIPHNKPKDPNYRKVVDKKYYEKHKREIYRNKRNRVSGYKKELVALLGGKCKKCGYDKCINALDFHHIKGDKEYQLSAMFNHSSKQKILKEANKCILLCANCHREMHYKGP